MYILAGKKVYPSCVELTSYKTYAYTVGVLVKPPWVFRIYPLVIWPVVTPRGVGLSPLRLSVSGILYEKM